MWFWWFVFICDLITPIIMIFGGLIMWKHTPKKINGVIGYRTSNSMKNMDTWNFAHAYCGKLWYKIGIVLLFSSLIMLFVIGKDENVVGIVGLVIMLGQIIPLLATIFKTEKALRQHFDKNGNVKDN